MNSNEALEATMYSLGDTGSQFTASLEERLVVCPSSKSMPAMITAEVRITGSTTRTCNVIGRIRLMNSGGTRGRKYKSNPNGARNMTTSKKTSAMGLDRKLLRPKRFALKYDL
ncbi:MAG: hypothetical protein ABSB40_04855 [Nitrososphaeria archaeon]